MLEAVVGDVAYRVHTETGTQDDRLLLDCPFFVARSTLADDSVLTAAVVEWIFTGQDLVG